MPKNDNEQLVVKPSKWKNFKDTYFLVGSIDIPFLGLTIALLTIGLIMLFSASYPYAYYYKDSSYYYFIRQLIIAVGGLVGRAPPGCGADLRRKGHRPCRLRRDADRRGRSGLDGQLDAGAVRLLEHDANRIPLDELACRAARRPLLVLRILRGTLSRTAPYLCRVRPRKPNETL